MKHFFLSLVGCLLTLAAPLASAQNSDTADSVAEPSSRYELRAEYDADLLPLLADGQQQISFRIQVVDTEAQIIKRLKFLLQNDDPDHSGSIESETLRNQYLVTYTAPDLRDQQGKQFTDRLIITYTDEEDRQRYKEIDVPLRNANSITVQKPGFLPAELPVSLSGPFAYVQVQAKVSGDETVAVPAAELTGPLLPEPLHTDADGQVKLHNPEEPRDSAVAEYSVQLKPDPQYTGLARQILRDYRAASQQEYGATNVVIEDFLDAFPRYLAEAESSEAAERLISGLYRIRNVTYLISRGTNTAVYTANNTATATRNQLWETVDLHGEITLLTETIRERLEEAIPTESEYAQHHRRELQELLTSYPTHFIELASSVSGITIGLHTPELNASTVNGLFTNIIDLVTDKETSGRAWGESWFKRDVAVYFKQQQHMLAEDFYELVAAMIENRSFSAEYDTDALKEQRERFRQNTNRILAEERVETDPLLSDTELKKHFLHTKVESAGLAYNSLVTAAEQTLTTISAAYIEDDTMAKWLSLHELGSEQTKQATNEAAGFAKADIGQTPLIIPLVLADGPLYTHTHDPMMEQVSRYQLAVTRTILYEQLRDIGRLLITLNIDRDIVRLTLDGVEERLQAAQARVAALAQTVPAEYRTYAGDFMPITRSNAVPLWRIILFAFLVIGGMTYLIYVLLTNPERAKEAIRPRTPEDLMGKGFSDTIKTG